MSAADDARDRPGRYLSLFYRSVGNQQISMGVVADAGLAGLFERLAAATMAAGVAALGVGSLGRSRT